MSVKFLVLGGVGILGFSGGGGCRFYFYGRGDFSDTGGCSSYTCECRATLCNCMATDREKKGATVLVYSLFVLFSGRQMNTCHVQ